jgi:hypothetical protein
MMINYFIISIPIVMVLVIFSFVGSALATNSNLFTLKSPAFTKGNNIPKKFTCDGENISPELIWENIPIGTVSLVLICEDPDAPIGIWVHWILYNIPVTLNSIPENLNSRKEWISQQKVMVGINDFKKAEYGGPCPPPGKPHHYIFRLFALDIRLDAQPGLNRNQILNAIKGHILKEAQLVGIYGR